MLQCKKSLASAFSDHLCCVCGAASAAPHLGRFLPKLGGTARCRLFFVQGAQMCLAQARQCGWLQNPGRLRGKMAPILAGEGMAAKLSIK
jgi:hypothetical protein